MRGVAVLCALGLGCGFSGAGTADDDDDDRDPDAPPGTPDAPPGTPDAAPPSPPDATPTIVCPADYATQFGSSRYRLSFAPATWLAAEADCEDDTAGRWSHLVSLDDVDEWTWAVNTVVLLPGDPWFHIGVLRDAGDPSAEWRSVTGGPAFTRWRQSPGGDEPNNAGSGEPVVALDTNVSSQNEPDYGGYVDVGLAFTTFYACECDGLPPVNAAP